MYVRKCIDYVLSHSNVLSYRNLRTLRFLASVLLSIKVRLQLSFLSLWLYLTYSIYEYYRLMCFFKCRSSWRQRSKSCQCSFSWSCIHRENGDFCQYRRSCSANKVLTVFAARQLPSSQCASHRARALVDWLSSMQICNTELWSHTGGGGCEWDICPPLNPL